MAKSGFCYKFTMRELTTLLFGAKKCHKCGGSLKKYKGCDIVDGRSINAKCDAFFKPNAQVRSYYYYFTCQSCGKSISLTELANKK